MTRGANGVACAAALAAAGAVALPDNGARAADWSNTAISWRYGTNYFNLYLLESDRNDPASLNGREGAQEAYVVYRHTFDIGALRGEPIRFGKVKGVGLVLGFDWNTKNDVGCNSRKRMLVAGPTLMWDVRVGGVPRAEYHF